MKPTILSVPIVLVLVALSACQSVNRSEMDGGPVQREMDNLCSEYGLPGMTVAWAVDGDLQGTTASGWADVERRKPMTPTTRMLAASIGKSFVGALCVVLDHEDRLSLDEPIARWLGHETWFNRLANRETITLRHLLTHTAGLPDHVHTLAFARAFSVAWPDGENHFAPSELVAFILDEPALFPVGKGWAYSDTGYILAGLVVEAATGQPLFQQIHDRFLAPLHLGDTEAADRRDLRDLAAGYPCGNNSFAFPRRSINQEGHLLWHPGVEWAGGGLVSSSADLARWGATIFAPGGMRGSLSGEMLSTVPMSSDDDSGRYGLGIGVSAGRYGLVYGHAGWIPGYISSLRHYPYLGITIAIQINTDVGIADAKDDVLGRIEKHILQAILAAIVPFAQEAEHDTW